MGVGWVGGWGTWAGHGAAGSRGLTASTTVGMCEVALCYLHPPQSARPPSFLPQCTSPTCRWMPSCGGAASRGACWRPPKRWSPRSGSARSACTPGWQTRQLSSCTCPLASRCCPGTMPWWPRWVVQACRVPGRAGHAMLLDVRAGGALDERLSGCVLVQMHRRELNACGCLLCPSRSAAAAQPPGPAGEGHHTARAHAQAPVGWGPLRSSLPLPLAVPGPGPAAF